MDDPVATQKYMNAQALRYQRFMRIWSSAAFVYPLLVMIAIIYDLMPYSVLMAALGGATMVYMIHHQKHGNMNHWWWFRKGRMVSLKSFDKIEEARRWIKTQQYEFFEVQPGTFKFFNTSQAVHFKLVWA